MGTLFILCWSHPSEPSPGKPARSEVTRPRDQGAQSVAEAAPGPAGPCAPSCACRRWGSPGCGRAGSGSGSGLAAWAAPEARAQNFDPGPLPGPPPGVAAVCSVGMRGADNSRYPLKPGASGRRSPVTWRGNPARPPVPWGKPGPTLREGVRAGGPFPSRHWAPRPVPLSSPGPRPPGPEGGCWGRAA